MTRSEIAQVLDRLPLLNDDGIGLYDLDRWLTAEERSWQLTRLRSALLANKEQCTAACAWLNDKEKTKTINRRHSSYGYKHMVEESAGHYISNGAFIVAAIHCGFHYQIVLDSPNVMFGISERSLRRAQTPGQRLGISPMGGAPR